MLHFLNRQKPYIVIAAVLAFTALLYLINVTIVKNIPAGTDFLVHWQGSAGLLRDGIDPYSDAAIGNILSAASTNGFRLTAEEIRYNSPLFALLFYAPVSLIRNFGVARAVWMTFLEFTLIGCGILSITMVPVKKPGWIAAISMVFLVLSSLSVSSLMQGGSHILALFFVLLAVYMQVNGAEDASGLFLALALIKPDYVYLAVLLILARSVITRRYRIVWWFLGTLVMLVGFTLLLVPNWPLQYFLGNVNTIPVNAVGTPGYVEQLWGNADIARRLLIAKDVGLILILVYEWVLVKNQGKLRLVWAGCLSLVVSALIGKSLNTVGMLNTLPVIIIGFAFLYQRWTNQASMVYILILVSIFALLWVFSGMLISDFPLVFMKIFSLFLLPLMAVLILYWVRWWVTRSSKFGDGL